jgi:alpha/beta superfamily hydrolase
LILRPNFRGVGASQVTRDQGHVEAEGLPLALGCFSFGAFVQCCVARRLADAGRPAAHVVLARMGLSPAPWASTWRWCT